MGNPNERLDCSDMDQATDDYIKALAKANHQIAKLQARVVELEAACQQVIRHIGCTCPRSWPRAGNHDERSCVLRYVGDALSSAHAPSPLLELVKAFLFSRQKRNKHARALFAGETTEENPPEEVIQSVEKIDQILVAHPWLKELAEEAGR